MKTPAHRAERKGTTVRHQRARPGLPRALVVGTGRGLVAGLVAGVICGVGARIAMRIAALAAGNETGFTLGGTVGVVFIPVVIGAPLGIIYVAVRRWLPGSGLRRGLVFGILFLLLGGVPLFMDATNPNSVFR